MRIAREIFFLLIFSSLSFANDEVPNLRKFTTDYCTSYPEGTFSKPTLWRHCCLEHDIYFWAGGTKSDRKQADLQLKACIEDTGEIRIARLMYYAVYLGGRSPIKLPGKKWGNGWINRKGYFSLTMEETELVINELENTPIASPLLEQIKSTLRSRLE